MCVQLSCIIADHDSLWVNLHSFTLLFLSQLYHQMGQKNRSVHLVKDSCNVFQAERIHASQFVHPNLLKVRRTELTKISPINK